MRRQGSLYRIEEIEKLLLLQGHGKLKVTSGKRGDYAQMGISGPSSKFVKVLVVHVPIGITFEHDERNGEGRIIIKDDNVGRLCTKVPGLLERLAELTDLGDGQYPVRQNEKGVREP